MKQYVEKLNVVSLYAKILPEFLENFVEWQGQLNFEIASFPGFVSLEIISPNKQLDPWVIVQRFDNSENAALWLSSSKRENLIIQLQKYVATENDIKEINGGESNLDGGVTEVFVTEVNPEMDAEYRQWIAKIHKAEAKSPGFRGVYVQSPSDKNSKNWITFLQFDNTENLDRWLTSSERQKVLSESKILIKSLENQRVVSSFGGWFNSLAKEGVVPPVWKQTMIVLLILFPIVMLEQKYLSPLLFNQNQSLATFIGNAISVGLIAWPLMPLAIFALNWWLLLKGENKRLTNFLGTILILVFYVLEIAIFWNVL